MAAYSRAGGGAGSRAVLPCEISGIVTGENTTFQGPEGYVRSRGVKVEVVRDAMCIQLMCDFIAARPELWDEDVGV